MKDLLFDQQRTLALTVPCEYCGQPAGELCVRLPHGESLEHQAAHWLRITAAGKASANR